MIFCRGGKLLQWSPLVRSPFSIKTTYSLRNFQAPPLMRTSYMDAPSDDCTCWSFTFHRPNTPLVNISVIGFLSKKIEWDSERFWVNATIGENFRWLWTLSVWVYGHDDVANVDQSAYLFRFLFKGKRGCIRLQRIQLTYPSPQSPKKGKRV